MQGPKGCPNPRTKASAPGIGSRLGEADCGHKAQRVLGVEQDLQRLQEGLQAPFGSLLRRFGRGALGILEIDLVPQEDGDPGYRGERHVLAVGAEGRKHRALLHVVGHITRGPQLAQQLASARVVQSGHAAHRARKQVAAVRGEGGHPARVGGLVLAGARGLCRLGGAISWGRQAPDLGAGEGGRIMGQWGSVVDFQALRRCGGADAASTGGLVLPQNLKPFFGGTLHVWSSLAVAQKRLSADTQTSPTRPLCPASV